MNKTLKVASLLALLAGCSASTSENDDAVLGVKSQALTSLASTDWMGAMPSLATKRLNELSIPATHDSATYGLISAWERPVEDPYAPDSAGALVDAGSYFGISPAWAKAQEKTIAEQLADGIRAIDLRPCREKSGTLRICHGLYGPTMSDLLDQVKTFADAHPKEVIFVGLGAFSGMEDADHTTLADLVTSKLGQRLLNVASAGVTPTSTLGEVWAKNAGSVVVLYDKAAPPSSAFMSKTSWENSWVDTWDKDTKKASLVSAMASAQSNKLFWFSGQATPDGDGDLIIKSLNPLGNYPSSLGMLADQTNPVVLGWVVNEWSGKRLNMLSFDFYNRTCLVKIAQKRNGADVSLDGCDIGTTTAWGNYADKPYERGAGASMVCGANEENVAGLCYPKCAAGYASSTAFPTVCSKPCPSGYRDDGLTCFRDASIVSANNSSCPWYDKCGLTFKKGCSVCPAGYSNDGCTCRRDPNMVVKARYDRGVGKVPSTCATGTVQDGLLCYPPCKAGFGAAGPVCWPKR